MRKRIRYPKEPITITDRNSAAIQLATAHTLSGVIAWKAWRGDWLGVGTVLTYRLNANGLYVRYKDGSAGLWTATDFSELYEAILYYGLSETT